MVTRTGGRLPAPRPSTTSGGTGRPVAVVPPSSTVVRNFMARECARNPLRRHPARSRAGCRLPAGVGLGVADLTCPLRVGPPALGFLVFWCPADDRWRSRATAPPRGASETGVWVGPGIGGYRSQPRRPGPRAWVRAHRGTGIGEDP